jgi:photosynthetic reaction center cytochrome c subunit
VQNGLRGTAMEINYVARDVNTAMADLQQRMPAILPAAQAGGPAPQWQNVQVLNDISVNEFNRTMIAMTSWVAGNPGNCAYCHNLANFAADTYPDGEEIYTKAVARRMIQMTREVNSNWSDHVANTGVTCYTCHIGQAAAERALVLYGREPDAAALSRQPRGARRLADGRAEQCQPFQREADGMAMRQ